MTPTMRRAFVVLAGILFATSCRKCGGDEQAGAADSAPADTETVPDEPAPVDAARPTRDAQPAIDDARLLDGGASDAACTGAEIDLVAALSDPRCAINSTAAKRMAAAFDDAGVPTSLRQDAKVLADGRVVVRLINTGKTALALPLSFHPKITPFTALAEDETNRAIYELEPPRLEALDGGGVGLPGARFARIVLPPGGAGVARAAIGTAIVKRIAPSCEAGTCAPPSLPPGKYVLHVGQLLADVEAGAPAQLPWQAR
jgi:hypothetical protein